MSRIPQEYTDALREVERLFDSHQLTVESFGKLWDTATEALAKADAKTAELMEGFVLFAPEEWLLQNREAD